MADRPTRGGRYILQEGGTRQRVSGPERQVRVRAVKRRSSPAPAPADEKEAEKNA